MDENFITSSNRGGYAFSMFCISVCVPYIAGYLENGFGVEPEQI